MAELQALSKGIGEIGLLKKSGWESWATGWSAEKEEPDIYRSPEDCEKGHPSSLVGRPGGLRWVIVENGTEICQIAEC